MDIEVPPTRDEVEISLFGPGCGESVVVHLGADEWLIVDSCIDSMSGEPAALAYLGALRVSLDNVVRIVGTHWHDDHVRGLAKVVRSCPRAHFYFSAMLKDEDFRVLVESGSHSMMEAPGTSELAEILATFEKRRLASGARPKFAGSNKVIWERDTDQVRCLSPSDDAVRKSLMRIGQQLPEARVGKRRIGDVRPNDASVVLLLRVGHRVVLLGGDLEKQRNPDVGWLAVIADWLALGAKGDVFKVPHHGSDNADQPEVWDQMLEPNPTAVLTPFVRSRLPKPTDVLRICRHTNRAYMTAPNEPGSRRTRRAAVEKTIEGAIRYLREAEPPTGHIRLRAPVAGNSPWSVELFGPAHCICA